MLNILNFEYLTFIQGALLVLAEPELYKVQLANNNSVAQKEKDLKMCILCANACF